MQILVRLETVNRDTKVKGWGNELVMDVRAKRLLDPDKNSNAYIADDGNSIVREFVVELDDYSDEDIKEYKAKLEKNVGVKFDEETNIPRKSKF